MSYTFYPICAPTQLQENRSYYMYANHFKRKAMAQKKLDWFQAAQVVYDNWGMVSGFGFSLSGQGYSETWLEIIRDVSMRVL